MALQLLDPVGVTVSEEHRVLQCQLFLELRWLCVDGQPMLDELPVTKTALAALVLPVGDFASQVTAGASVQFCSFSSFSFLFFCSVSFSFYRLSVLLCLCSGL